MEGDRVESIKREKVRVLRVVPLLALLIVGLLSQFVLIEAVPSLCSTKTQMLQKFSQLEITYGSMVSSEIVGYTVRGEGIQMWRVGNLSSERIILVDASRHGGEYVTTEALYLAVKWILTSNNSYAIAVRRYQIFVVPIVNLDKYQLSRYNSHGVDLNRNFEFKWSVNTNTYRGSFPCSEPETQAFEYIFSRYEISWYLTLHAGDYRITPAYWSGMSHPTTFYQSVYSKISSITRSFGISAISLVLYGGYAGTSTNDAYYSHGIYSFTVECTYSYTPSYSTTVKYITQRIQGVIAGVALYG